MSPHRIIGWDLGGAHLKAAALNPAGEVERVLQLPCPLWQGLGHLEAAVTQVLADLGAADEHAITMTGEMVDLFPNRDVGVRRLVTAMQERLPGAKLRFYAGGAGFLDPAEARVSGARIASANWMATATLVAARVGSALLVDIGSTTTDLVPVVAGRVASHGNNDATRLVAGELVYTGIVRTPIMALAERAPFDGQWVPLMAEVFATAADLYRLIGQLPVDADLHPAADGGEKTVLASARRLARMLGRDVESAPNHAWQRLAQWLVRRQTRRIEDACDRLLSLGEVPEGAPMVGAGIGRFLVEELALRRGRPWVDFGALMSAAGPAGSRVADCAPAVAVAWLALQSH